jgi:hypothetical protein
LDHRKAETGIFYDAQKGYSKSRGVKVEFTGEKERRSY